MLKVDNLEKAKKEGRAPWTDVVYDFKDMVWYNDCLLYTSDAADE